MMACCITPSVIAKEIAKGNLEVVFRMCKEFDILVPQVQVLVACFSVLLG